MKVRHAANFIAAFFLLLNSFENVAHAKTIQTPFGEADESCVHETPMGGGIDVGTGDVKLDGKTIDHFESCKVPWKRRLPQDSTHSNLFTSNGWFAWTDAQQVSIGGASYPFDKYEFAVYVPTAPNPPAGDSPLIGLFGSLENNQGISSNGEGCGTNKNIAIIQPVLTWGSSGSLGGPNWYMAAWEVFECNSDCTTACSVGHSPYVQVSPGNLLYGSIIQSSSNLDSWEILWQNNSTSGYTYNFLYNIPNSWPKFGSLQGGVQEVYNVNSCSDLSSDNSIRFYNYGVFAAYPNWYSDYRVDYYGSNALQWSTNDGTPGCSSGAYIANFSDSVIYWTE